MCKFPLPMAQAVRILSYEWLLSVFRKDNKLEWMQRVKRLHFRMPVQTGTIASSRHGMDRMPYLHVNGENKRVKLMEIDTRGTSKQAEWGRERVCVSGNGMRANSRGKCHSVQRLQRDKGILKSHILLRFRHCHHFYRTLLSVISVWMGSRRRVVHANRNE